ncbi:hypothetical protein V5O48_008673 [Marasmius crinis-equi]|uniref:Uncharacterized protein n=1 Tax=Marasmius crinis-equi TaxID=585013 RepID=A0ABR3FD84_9AGAR
MVALESPSLWTKPDFRFPTIALETLKRTGSRPLSLMLNANLARDVVQQEELAIEVLKGYLSQTASLEVKFPTTALERILNTAVGPASLLHTLKLTNCIAIEAASITLPENFLGKASSGLRRLSVERFSIPWNSTFLKDLTHLEIISPSGSTSDFSVSQLGQVLRGCPALEALSVCSCLSLTGEAIPPVELPKLCQMDVTATMPVLIKVMSSLKLPSSTERQLTVIIDESPVDITRLLRLSLSPEGEQPPKELAILSFRRTKESGSYAWSAWDEIPFQGFSKPSFILNFLVRSNFVPPDFGECMHTFLEVAPISNLLMLHLDNITSIPPRTIYLLSTLPKLAAFTLNACPGCESAVIEGLVHPEETGGDASQPRLPFPSLISLDLSNVVFGPLPQGVELKSLLFRNLSFRSKRGARLARLGLTACEGLVKEDMDELKNLVRVVARVD